MEVTVPLTFGFHMVTLYGAVALKLKTLFRETGVPPWVILVKLPTANMVPRHCTSCRTCSVCPVEASAGVAVAGTGETGPVAAAAGASPDALTATAQMTAPGRLSGSQRRNLRMMPPISFAVTARPPHPTPRCVRLVRICPWETAF